MCTVRSTIPRQAIAGITGLDEDILDQIVLIPQQTRPRWQVLGGHDFRAIAPEASGMSEVSKRGEAIASVIIIVEINPVSLIPCEPHPDSLPICL